MTDTPTSQLEALILGQLPDSLLPVGHLPLRDVGLLHCPAIPFWPSMWGTPDAVRVQNTVLHLQARGEKATPAYDGLSTPYTIGKFTRPAYAFLYPPDREHWTPLNELALQDASQFTLPWTTYGGVYGNFQDLVQAFSESLTSAASATERFWPMIANFGLPYNLLILAKVDASRSAGLAADFGDAWAAQHMDELQAAGLLYEIDMRIVTLEPTTHVHPGTNNSDVRFTPGTLTVLKQDPQSKALTPIAIQVSTTGGLKQTFLPTDNAWLYALQAAKTSITVYGIWLGHVYQWHTVTAALQMTMYNRLPDTHRLWPLLRQQSQSLIDFDFVLLAALWEIIAPPTPVDGPISLVTLLNRFSENREFFDDDPPTALKQYGLKQEDFTVHEPWDAYPLVGSLLEIWNLTSDFVTAVVNDLYSDDGEVAGDARLKAWMDASSDPSQGNVSGLPEMHTKADLIAVLTSLLYRVTVHGVASLNPSVHPALSFMANFPPCLQRADIPDRSAQMSPSQLLDLLPHTGTLGGMTTFYFTFAYTPPDVSLIPSGGVNLDLYFPPGHERCNDALISYRDRIHAFIDSYFERSDQALRRWGHDPRTPPDAVGEYHQWARSIEI